MRDTTASRVFIDLIRQASSKWANWDPSIEIKAGDYGTIDHETGELDVEGNIYDEGFQTLLHNQDLKINLSEPSCQPQKGRCDDNMIISSSGVKQCDFAVQPDSVPFLNLASASVKTAFQIQEGKRGAVLVMHKPQHEYIPRGKVLNLVRRAVELHDKYLVTSTFTCPGYYIYLSNKSGERIALALTASAPIPAAVGLTAGGIASIDWWTDAQSAFLRKKFDKAGQYRYTPLYTMKHIQDTWVRRLFREGGTGRHSLPELAQVPTTLKPVRPPPDNKEINNHARDESAEGDENDFSDLQQQDVYVKQPGISILKHPLDTCEACGSDKKFLLFDIFTINTTICNACNAGDLHTAEELLTQEIGADGDNYDCYSNRSVVRARNSEWDKALQDSIKSIDIQPSLLGYISKGIALCGNERLSDAMEAFDLASVSLNRGPITAELLLLIKAVALFNASHHDEAMRRVHDMATAYQHLDTLLSSVVKSYLRVQLAMIAFEDEQYSEAIDRLNDSIPSMADLFSRRTLFEANLNIFARLFGWDWDSLWQTANKRRCDAFLRADRVVEAVETYQYMMCIIDEDQNLNNDPKWIAAFKKHCTACSVAKGDEAVAAGNYERAIELYSAGIELDSSYEPLFAHRGKAHLEQNFYAEALHDADRVIELNPSSYIGYELKYAAFHGAQRYDEAIEAFTTMFSKLDDSDAPCSWVQHSHGQYISPSTAERAIRGAIHAHLENAPHRLLNISTGHLCDRGAQTNAFMESTEYKKILLSSMTHVPLQTEPIKTVVAEYFSWVMLSHRWESKEPLLHDIQDKDVFSLDPVGTMMKLQAFCTTAGDAGYIWAWSDTCCIDRNNSVEVQESVNSMFVWYRHSALTIVYLSDVPPSSKPGALANSVWITRGWTVQEFLAPNIVLFYQADWTLYRGDCSPNHKESAVIMQELEHSTGINVRALAAFRPEMRDARDKLQWSSSRVTTLQEDIAYSLFGIFRVHLPVIYGEKKQNALGRLLQEIIARSGDITALDWVGKSSEFNSCLPADITSYKAPPCTLPSLTEDEIHASVLMLRNNVAVDAASKLYSLLDNLSAPRFANSRLQLPCIAFPVKEVRRRRGQDPESCFTYDVKAHGLHDLVITTKDKVAQPARPIRQTFLLIRPWNRYDLELPDVADERQSIVDWSEPGDNELADSGAHSRELRLIVRLGQPFGALLLAQQHGGEYKRITSDNNIIAQVREMTSVHDMMDVRRLEIL